MQYLIIECIELDDQCECDAHRIPVCLTDDYSKYLGYGYEILEVLEDNTFNQIKDYEQDIRHIYKKER